MHHPNRWPIVLGPGGTQNVAKLRIMERVNELERNWIKFDGQIRSYHVKMNELFANFSRNPAVPSPQSVEKVGKKTRNKLNEEKSMEEMGEAIEKALMHEKTTKINKVQEIRDALKRAFAEGRSKEKENGIKTFAVIKESEKLPQAKQPINSKMTSDSAIETRFSHAAAKITENDNYSVRSMELDDLKQRPVKEIPKQEQDEKLKQPIKNIEKPKRATEQSESSAFKYPLLKRRYQAYENAQQSTPPKRVKSSQSLVKSDAKPNSKNFRYINPMSISIYGKIPKKSFRSSQATYKTVPSISLSSDHQSAKEQSNHIEPTIAHPTKGAMKQYGPSTSPVAKQMSIHNCQTTSVLAAQQSKSSDANFISDSEMDEDLYTDHNTALELKTKQADAITSSSLVRTNQTGSYAPVLPEQRSEQSDADDTGGDSALNLKIIRNIKHEQTDADDISNSEEDDDLPIDRNLALELEIKQEMQDAITNPSMAKLNGIYFHLFRLQHIFT